jgi:signal transduction histidine kinase
MVNMLHEFLTVHREELITRTRAKVAGRSAPRATEEEMKNGVPLFLDQLGENLRLSRVTSEAIGHSAAEHGGDLLRMGFSVSQVVHGYGDVCQAVTELAHETSTPISTDDFHTFNRCLDDAIAGAVTEYTRRRDLSLAGEETERLGALAHELRNHLYAATLAFDMLKMGHVGMGGSTSSVVSRSLEHLREIIARSLAAVRLEAPIQRRERVSVSELVEEMEVEGTIQANARGVGFHVMPAPRGVDIEVDREILAAALTNLLQNAFKFTRPGGHVSLTTTATVDRVLMDVEDECGGLTPGKAEDLFRPFERRSGDRTGLGLGLSISRKGIEANGGVIRVRDLPGRGCVFTIDLPRLPPP